MTWPVRPARVACGAGLLLVLALAGVARPDPPGPAPEPPSDAPEGADYETAIADTIATGLAEADFGMSGREGQAARARRRFRIRDGDFTGEAREGAGDALAGGSIEARGAGGRWSAGHLRLVWLRGLSLGGSVEPWRAGPADGADLGTGAAGGGVRWESGPPDGDPSSTGVEALAGRFAGTDLAGVRVRAAGMSLGGLIARLRPGRTLAQAIGFGASLGVEREALAAELALDDAGRWRAETATDRPFGALKLLARVRAGHVAYHALAGPRRADPAQALSVRLERAGGAVRPGVLGALWRFRPGLGGARAALEVEGRLAHHSSIAAGLEEQRGARRDPDALPDRFRQGAWVGWRGGPERLGLSLYQESWGERAWARGAVRSVVAAGVDVSGPAGARLRVAHCVYRARRGESLYLAEAESDRLVLRALTGAGERTRIEVRLPFAGGFARGAAGWTAAAAPPRVQWSVDWIRRASFRRST